MIWIKLPHGDRAHCLSPKTGRLGRMKKPIVKGPRVPVYRPRFKFVE